MAELGDYIRKLIHPIDEIRVRAVNTLVQKCEVGLVSGVELSQQTDLLPHTLTCLDLGPHSLRHPLLKLLIFILEDEDTRDNFGRLGGPQKLLHLRATAPLDLLPPLTQLLNFLHLTPRHAYTRTSSSATENVSVSEDSEVPSSSGTQAVGYQHLRTNLDDSNYMDSFCDLTLPDRPTGTDSDPQYSPVTFSTFPWLALASSDRRVLESTAVSLLSQNEREVLATLHFLNTVLLPDFPPEVLLQRPAVIQAVYGCIMEVEGGGWAGWRVQAPACSALMAFTRLLITRVNQFTHPHLTPGKDLEGSRAPSEAGSGHESIVRGSCCFLRGGHYLNDGFRDLGQRQAEAAGSPGRETLRGSVHEEDDGDEFILLGLHQLTVPGYCFHTLQAACPLLASHRPAVQSASLCLITSVLTLLRLCVCPHRMWEAEEELQQGDSLARRCLHVIRSVCHLILASSTARQLVETQTEAQRLVINTHCFSLLLCHILHDFVPLDAAPMVVSGDVTDGLMSVLCNGGFYLAYRPIHTALLTYLDQANPSATSQVRSVLFAADSLQATCEFLRASGMGLAPLLGLAERSLPSSCIHQSTSFVDKLVERVSDTLAEGSMGEEELRRARELVLAVLRYPDLTVKLTGYRCLARVVERSLGVTQAANTTLSDSPRVLLLLHPSIITLILYEGLNNQHKEITNLSKDILLFTLKGQLLMTKRVWEAARECWCQCLPHLLCLANHSTSLGRAIDKLPVAVFGDDPTLENIEVLRYHLQGLFLRKMETRVQFVSQVVQKLALTSHIFLPDPDTFSFTLHHDLFIGHQPINLLFTGGNMVVEESQLAKVVELMVSEGVSGSIRKVAWSQLAFLLEDPTLHQPFFSLCSLQYIIHSFIGMLKREGNGHLTLDLIPGAVEALRLLATHSPQVVHTLRHDPVFLLCIVRAALLYYTDERTRCQASCLLALLVFSDIITHTSIDQEEDEATGGRRRKRTNRNLLSVPELVITNIQLPFVCKSSAWMEEADLCAEMRAVHQLLQEGDVETLEFFRAVWASGRTQGGLEHITPDQQDQQDLSFSATLQMSQAEVDVLKSSVYRLVLDSLLKNIENATSHQDVKSNATSLRFLVQQIELRDECSEKEDVFTWPQWCQTFQRFLTSAPNSSVDEQLLVHLLTSLSVCVQVYMSGREGKVCPPHLQLFLHELANPASALHHTLQCSGSVRWQPRESSPRSLLSARLFHSVTRLIQDSLEFCRRICKTSDGGETMGLCDQVAAVVVSSLLPFLDTSTNHQHYNLGVLVCSLECLTHTTATTKSLPEHLAPTLTAACVRLIKAFHLGRGRAHNSYIGRGVTLHCALIITNVLSHPTTPHTHKVLNALWEEEEAEGTEGGWEWLVSLWVHRDSLISSSGLSLAAAVARHERGAAALRNNLTQVSGGVWGAALSYLLPDAKSCLVRSSACELLLQLTRCPPSPSHPWTSPVVADTLTGESVEGLPALMVLLLHSDFYHKVHSTLVRLNALQHQHTVEHPEAPGEWDLSLSHLSTFCDMPDDEGQGGGGSEDCRLTVSLELYEILLRLLVNIILLKPPDVIPQLLSCGTVDLLIKHLRFIVCNIRTSSPHLQVTETALVLIGAVLKHKPSEAHYLAQDTSLVHLTLVVLSSEVGKASLCLVSLEVLNALVCGGGWGAIRVAQWISVSPALTFHPIVVALHSSFPVALQSAAGAFLTNLLRDVLHHEPLVTQTDLRTAITGALDDHTQLSDGHKICLGWELASHIVHLVCDLPDTHSQDKNNNSDVSLAKSTKVRPDLKHQLLDALKLLLVISQSAKDCAFHLQNFLLPQVTQPFKVIHEKLSSINLHITGNLMKNKDVKEYVSAAVQNLEVATNWVEGRRYDEKVSETLIPLLHPLWTSALHTPSLLTAILRFVMTASAHHQACLVLTRTSGLPGVLLSTSRTKRPLLSCVTTQVTQLLTRLFSCNRVSASDVHELSRESFILCVSILTNCARLQECVYVMNKLDIVSTVIRWLESRIAIEQSQPLARFLVLHTTHHESQMALCKIVGWVDTILDLTHQDRLQTDALKILANMSLNHHAVPSLLASNHLISAILGFVECAEDNTDLALVILWSLVANNQRGKALITKEENARVRRCLAVALQSVDIEGNPHTTAFPHHTPAGLELLLLFLPSPLKHCFLLPNIHITADLEYQGITVKESGHSPV
ncbi:hypothetical protein Pcinc_018481 [Petrolisthes cinctipes]|uniref:Rotatin n=1 Tax=Petrolisthes cinctipes TaxID=88211 RepID=A0AAE1KNQ7_PETCI|nr:hypothetical protein Pcinc_018481 [Petrolisthes cinctipes]